jgi:hypothetical protein
VPEALVVLPNESFTQMPISAAQAHPQSHLDDPFLDNPVMDYDSASHNNSGQIFVTEAMELDELQQHRRRKKERQWEKWANNVIPLLLRPHL